MSKLRVPIKDVSFAHSTGLTVHHDPQHIQWIREGFCDSVNVFFTDFFLPEAHTFKSPKRTALLVEPPHIYGAGYAAVKARPEVFTWVLTYDRQLLSIDPKKFLYYPIGGCWIPAKDQRTDHPKTKMVSIVASNKHFTPAHELRHEIMRKYKGKDVIDIFGRGHNPVEVKTAALAPYRYSIAMENAVIDSLFTEKLIDCFLTGTIPIYYGTSTIKEFFNPAGIFEFRTLEDLDRILSGLTPGVYDSLRPVIEENFQKALKYRTAEDWLWENYPFLFSDKSCLPTSIR